MNADISRFVYGTPGQMDALRKQLGDGAVLGQLFDQVRKDAQHYANEVPSDCRALFKRHLIHFLNSRCRGVHIDLTKLQREKLVRVSGEYPDQMLTLACAVGSRESSKKKLFSRELPTEEDSKRRAFCRLPLVDQGSSNHDIEAWFEEGHSTDPFFYYFFCDEAGVWGE